LERNATYIYFCSNQFYFEEIRAEIPYMFTRTVYKNRALITNDTLEKVYEKDVSNLIFLWVESQINAFDTALESTEDITDCLFDDLSIFVGKRVGILQKHKMKYFEFFNFHLEMSVDFFRDTKARSAMATQNLTHSVCL
jgi:hypothetical protein